MRLHLDRSRSAWAGRGRSAWRHAVLALLVALATGCGGEDEAPSTVTRGPGPLRGGALAPAAPAPPAPTGPAPRTRADQRVAPPSPASAGWLVDPIEQTETTTETTAGRPAERDYARELRTALGAPRECFPDALLAASTGTLRVPVRVVVTSGGRVTRAEAGGSLPDEVRECVRRHAEAVALAAPVEGAPRTISAEVVIEIQRQGGETAPPVAAPSAPSGAQPPAVTLPAVGAEGRPEGFVAPGTTLPAQGPAGRPEGFVPPDRTLPAIAP